MTWLGFIASHSWAVTVALAVTWLVLMLAYSPLADRLASRLVREPPKLGAFGSLQRSHGRLIVGIIVAWALGGVLEEVALRGVVLGHCETLTRWLAPGSLLLRRICLAAALGGVVHLYQGRRGALIVAQLSVLFGVPYVISGHDLWSVILCHGLYDTIAFVRFARRRSRYSDLAGGRSA